MTPHDPNSRPLARRREVTEAEFDISYPRQNGRMAASYAMPVDSEPASSAGIGFGDIARTLKSGAWKIALAGILGVSIGIATFVLRPVVYPARTTVEILGINENFMNFNLVDPQAGSGLYSATSANIQTQIRIIESAELRRRVLERLRLGNIPPLATNGGLAQRIRVKMGIVEAEPVAAMRQALNMAILTTRAGILRETRIIEIRCQSTSPEVAAAYLNTLVSEYADHTLEVRSLAARKTTEWLSNQLKDARERMTQAEAKMREFERTSGYTSSTPQETLAGNKVRQLRAELAAMQSDRIAKQTRWDAIKVTAPENLSNVVEDAALRSKEQQLLELRRQLADLRTTLTPNHYRVQKLMAQLAEVETEAKRDRRTIIDRARTEFETALAKERLLQTAHNTQSNVFASESWQAGQRQMLQREMDVAQQSYNGLMQQSTQASMVAAVPSTQARAIDPAESNVDPIGLGPIPRGILGFFAGCLLGCAFLVTREFMNRTVRTAKTAIEILRVPELGVIPTSVALPASRKKSRMFEKHAADQLGLSASRTDTVYQPNPEQTMFTESFRATLASLIRNTRPGAGAPAYVISSPGPMEGKTFVTANLGIAIAETGRRVVVVDMDLRRPGLSKFFKLDSKPGVGDIILSSDGPLDGDSVKDFAQETSVANLFLLSAGTLTGDKLPLILYNNRLTELLERLGQDFDFVLIDTAPIGLFADARVLGRLSDGVILVLRADQTTKDSAMETRRRMEDDGTPLVGMILNDSRIPEVPGYYLYHTGSEKPRNDYKS